MSNKVREERRRQNMSQEALSDKSGVSRMAIYKIEHGITKYPTMQVAIKIAGALDADITSLFDTQGVHTN